MGVEAKARCFWRRAEIPEDKNTGKSGRGGTDMVREGEACFSDEAARCGSGEETCGRCGVQAAKPSGDVQAKK